MQDLQNNFWVFLVVRDICLAIMALYYFEVIKRRAKVGPKGPRGDTGERGEVGDKGKDCECNNPNNYKV